MKKNIKMITLDAVKKIVVMTFFICFIVGCLNVKQKSNNNNDFSVFSECSDTQCVIYSRISDQTEVFDNSPGKHRIKRLNDHLYQIIYSCGNPCSNNVFVNDENDVDWSDKLIAYNNRCIIEFNIDENNFTSRQVFSKKSKEILKLDTNVDDTAIPIWLYSQNSSFNRDIFNVNIRQKDGSEKNYKIANPCNFD